MSQKDAAQKAGSLGVVPTLLSWLHYICPLKKLQKLLKEGDCPELKVFSGEQKSRERTASEDGSKGKKETLNGTQFQLWRVLAICDILWGPRSWEQCLTTEED